jgi:energy-converting hydrogenase Eha subunit H
MMAASDISWAGVVWRVVFAILLVMATFNPSGHSFYHWLTSAPAGITATKAFVGVLLLIGWVFCVRTAFVSLGMLGLVLGAALFGCAVWVLVDTGLLSLTGMTSMTWVVLLILGLLLGLGLSWSLVRARATGQVEVQ